MNLCIIITGQLRTFFIHSQQHFIDMLNLSKKSYTNILIICVISGNFNETTITDYFNKLNVSFLIIDYNKYIPIFNSRINQKINSEEYTKCKTEYLSYFNHAHYEINIKYSNDVPIKHSYQYHQLEIGINELLEYEKKYNIIYDVIMRTRFDIPYHKNFYPHFPNTILRKLLLTDTNIELYNKIIQKYKIADIVDFLKNQQIELPLCRVNLDYVSITFGGDYYYNNKSVENIMNGSDDILYAFNDYVYYAKRNVFLKLVNLFNDSYIKETNLNISHFYAPEAQLIIFCDNNSIDILMYRHYDSNGNRLDEPFRLP